MHLHWYQKVGIALMLAPIAGCDDTSQPTNKVEFADKNLQVVIIRHAEKPENGDNLSCQGQNRALQLATILHQKFSAPDYTYVPSLKTDKSTAHSRMFQTVTPLAIKYNLTINSKYQPDDYADIRDSVFKKTGTVLMVWSHSEIADLVSALGVKNPPEWDKADYDSIWVVNFKDDEATLTIDKEGLNPVQSCNF
jgi:hypothetical protein